MSKHRNQRGYIEDTLVMVGAGIVVLLLVGGIIGSIWYTIASYHHHETRICTVESKDRTAKPKGGSDARIYTTDCGVFQVADAMFAGHFNSADTYSQIEPGHTYRFDTIGFRVPFLSDFPNIVKVSEVAR